MKNRYVAVFAVSFLTLGLFLCTGCGDDDNPTTPGGGGAAQQDIGPAGGSIRIDGTAELEVPAGSLGGNVTFTMAKNTSPSPAPAGRAIAGSVVSVGPSGTTFSQPSTITMNYDPADLGGTSEAALVIYTNDGTGWTPLGSTVDPADHQVAAQTTHLSDFAVMTGGAVADGVFSVLTVERSVMNLDTPTMTDVIMARFDSQVDTVQALNPLHPDSVSCNEFGLEWNASLQSYVRLSSGTPFLTLGEDYVFDVQASDDVPAAMATVTFPATAPAVDNINNLQGLPLDGFTVEWSGAEAGTTVFLSLAPEFSSDPVVNIETENDGSYSFTADDLSGITAGLYGLVLTRKVMTAITTEGYDPASFVLAQVVNFTLVDMGGEAPGGNIGPEGGVIIIGDSDGFLDVPAGALSTTVLIDAVENTEPRQAPDGWRFLSPVFTLSIDPNGTTFATPAEISFDYADEDLLGGDENEITIFMDGGIGWTSLATTVDDGTNNAFAMTSDVADFSLMINDTSTEGVYADLILQRSINDFGGAVIRGDEFYARFDEYVAPVEAVSPLHPASVDLDGYECVWIEDDGRFRYTNVENIAPTFYSLGESYDITVAAGDGVPDLDIPATFVGSEPYVTNLQVGDTVSLDGFEVQWAGAGEGNVILTIYGPNNALVVVQTENDGSYTFTAAQLSGIPSELPEINLELAFQTRENLAIAGLDPRSVMLVRTYNQTGLLTTPAGGGK